MYTKLFLNSDALTEVTIVLVKKTQS